MFQNIYKNKKVLITGNTGFKGSWLTSWLLELGAQVYGYSDCIPTQPSIFEELELSSQIQHQFSDIRNFERLQGAFQKIRPDFVFHLAAQPIVSESYDDPISTITTNINGTANILEVLRLLDYPCVAVLITSDKCYENVEWVWGYREIDALGGKDIYSASKGASEVLIHAYYHSFFRQKDSKVKIATGRAGNVIGGGDWSKDRIVADCMRSWSNGSPVEIRSPNSTRPWQHVLEPLSGYLTLGMLLANGYALSGESFNFGPRSEQNHTVVDLLSDLSRHWKFKFEHDAYRITSNIPFHEAGLLKLSCDKALYHMKWEPTLSYQQCVGLVGAWYDKFYNSDEDIYRITKDQIKYYVSVAEKKGLQWTR